MVCKEDVITWFKEAASYRRIDVMCSLLNMCIPFELRYLGTCIEEQGKHDYQELRGAAITANNMDKLAKDFATYKGLLDKCARHRLTIYLSLLHSRNYSCANWIYNTLIRTESVDTYLANNNFYKDVNLHTELLLLFTLALNHPAFTFEQKRHFGDMVSRLAISEPDVPVQPTLNLPPCPPGLGYNIKPPLPVHPMPLGVPKGHNEAPIPPPGIPLPTVHASDFGPGMWSRTPYTNTTCPPADLTAFPPPISPLVSQQSSPTTSRSVSPTRMYSCRPHPHPPPIPPVAYLERLPPPIQAISDQVLATQYNTDLKSVPIEEVHNEGLDKNSQSSTTGWMESMVLGNKLANGLIGGVPMTMPPPPPPPKCQQMYLSNEMQQLSLDGDVSLRCTSSSASASSTSSECHSPPDTPTGPGRGGPTPLPDSSQLSALPIVIPIQVPVQVPIQVPISITTTTTTSSTSASSINKLRNGSSSSNIGGGSSNSNIISCSSSSSSSSSNNNNTNTNTISNAPPPPGLPLPLPPVAVQVPLPLPVSIQVPVPVAAPSSTATSINNDISSGSNQAALAAAAAAAASLYTSTCTVPYSSHYAVPPPPPPTTTFHNRSYLYTQPYPPRPQFPTYQQNGEMPYLFPYLCMYSHSSAATIPPPKITCYNCGRCGHIGSECKEPTIEEITQKKGYQLDYTSPPPDAPPSAEK